jgi:hypothetical protein
MQGNNNDEFVHVMHAAIPAALPVHAGHAEHTELPGKKLNFPAWHCAHCVAPLTSLYRPGTHAVHPVAIAALEYVPVSHWMHELKPGGLYDPGLHEASTREINSAGVVVKMGSVDVS